MSLTPRSILLLVAVHQLDAAVRAALGVDRDAGRRERIDVAVDRPLADLELVGQHRGGDAATCLEQQEQLDEARRAHRGEDTREMATGSVRYFRR